MVNAPAPADISQQPGFLITIPGSRQSGCQPGGYRLPGHPADQEAGSIHGSGTTAIRQGAFQQSLQHGRSNSPVSILFPQGKRESFRKTEFMVRLPFLQIVHQSLFQPPPGFGTAPLSLLQGETPGHETILNAPLLHCRIRTLPDRTTQSKAGIAPDTSLTTFLYGTLFLNVPYMFSAGKGGPSSPATIRGTSAALAKIKPV